MSNDEINVTGINTNNQKNCIINNMPEIYSAIDVAFDKSIELSPIIDKLTVLGIDNIQICRPRFEYDVILKFAIVKRECFWYLEEALTKMFSYVDQNIIQLKDVITENNGIVFIDIAFYQYGTYPSLIFDGENMKKIHFLDANISIDAY